MHISEKADPWRLVELTPFDLPQSRFFNQYGAPRGNTLSIKRCAELLFDEMRSLSWPFSLYSPYRQLINKIITHMQYSCGAPFYDGALDLALREQIVNDQYEKSSLNIIKSTIDRNIDYQNRYYPQKYLSEFATGIKTTVLPRFNRFDDNFNGLGITVHDIYAMKINILALRIHHNTWEARVQYQAQDHFGLDDVDIMKKKFHQFKFFRIWFVLQRCNIFGFKPFITNMNAVVDIKGGKR